MPKSEPGATEEDQVPSEETAKSTRSVEEFSWSSKPVPKNELNQLIKDLKFGKPEQRLLAMMRLVGQEAAKAALPEIRKVLENAANVSEELWSAVLLASLGENSKEATVCLIKYLEPETSLPEELKVSLTCGATIGLSYVKGDEVVPELIAKMAQDNSSGQIRAVAMFALGALGDPSQKEFVSYHASQGDRAAQFALALYGEKTFPELDQINSSVAVIGEARRCRACKYVGEMEKTLLGTFKCPQCGKKGENALLIQPAVTDV